MVFVLLCLGSREKIVLADMEFRPKMVHICGQGTAAKQGVLPCALRRLVNSVRAPTARYKYSLVPALVFLTPHHSISIFKPSALSKPISLPRTKPKPKPLPTAMPFFKSSSKKNKTASAATTPAQTPRNSMQEQRTSQPRMTQDEAMHMILKNTMTNAATGPFIR